LKYEGNVSAREHRNERRESGNDETSKSEKMSKNRGPTKDIKSLGDWTDLKAEKIIAGKNARIYKEEKERKQLREAGGGFAFASVSSIAQINRT